MERCMQRREEKGSHEIMVDDLGPSGFLTNAPQEEIVHTYLLMQHFNAD